MEVHSSPLANAALQGTPFRDQELHGVASIKVIWQVNGAADNPECLCIMAEEGCTIAEIAGR